MKKLAFLLIGLVALQATAFAADDKPVKVTDLPQTAQQFISDHFSGHKVAMAKMDSELFEKSYEVIFTNGDKVEFDRSGEWTEVQYREGAVPAAIVPAAITKYVTENYPDAYIRVSNATATPTKSTSRTGGKSSSTSTSTSSTWTIDPTAGLKPTHIVNPIQKPFIHRRSAAYCRPTVYTTIREPLPCFLPIPAIT